MTKEQTTSRAGGPATGHPAARTEAPAPVELREVEKRYGERERAVTALRGVTLSFGSGTMTAVMGPSGSGKSTLLHCAAGIERPTQGRVLVDGAELGVLDENALTVLRRERIGFVFQAFNLVSALTAAQNVELPLRLAGRGPGREKCAAALERFGLGERAEHRPSELSGGQQQRVALARSRAQTTSRFRMGIRFLHGLDEAEHLFRAVKPLCSVDGRGVVSVLFEKRTKFHERVADGAGTHLEEGGDRRPSGNLAHGENRGKDSSLVGDLSVDDGTWVLLRSAPRRLCRIS